MVTTKFFERPQSGERAILVHASPDGLPDESEREEFAELALSAGAELVGELVSSRRRPDARYFIGRGKLDELRQLIIEQKAELVISSAALSPSQERNLEKEDICLGKKYTLTSQKFVILHQVLVLFHHHHTTISTPLKI